MQPTLRAATPEDAAGIAALTDAAYAVYLPRLGRKPMPMLDDHSARLAGNGITLIEENGETLGLISLEEELEALLIYSIAIRPGAQGRGLGRRLIAWAEDRARARGKPVLRLYTNALMTENQAIYRHVGFITTERRVEGPYTRVFMEKRL